MGVHTANITQANDEKAETVSPADGLLSQSSRNIADSFALILNSMQFWTNSLTESLETTQKTASSRKPSLPSHLPSQPTQHSTTPTCSILVKPSTPFWLTIAHASLNLTFCTTALPSSLNIRLLNSDSLQDNTPHNTLWHSGVAQTDKGMCTRSARHTVTQVWHTQTQVCVLDQLVTLILRCGTHRHRYVN